MGLGWALGAFANGRSASMMQPSIASRSSCPVPHRQDSGGLQLESGSFKRCLSGPSVETVEPARACGGPSSALNEGWALRNPKGAELNAQFGMQVSSVLARLARRLLQDTWPSEPHGAVGPGASWTAWRKHGKIPLRKSRPSWFASFACCLPL